MKSGSMEDADRLMKKGIDEGVFPGGVLIVSKDGNTLIHRPYGVADSIACRSMTNEIVFDLASLTKPLATTLCVLKLMEKKLVGLGHCLGELMPAINWGEKRNITMRQLLCHTSGLPDWRPYYSTLVKMPRGERKAALMTLVANEPLVNPLGCVGLYSDLGFMILGWVVEGVSGTPLDRFAVDEIYRPLGLSGLFFPGLNRHGYEKDRFAATEICPRRKKVICGVVHDDNAFAVGGVCGHAGLFGTAAAVNRLLLEILSGYRGESSFFRRDLLRLFLDKDDAGGRALGFDTPSPTGSSSGSWFSEKSVGHLGFTGTSFWMDLEKSIIVALFTNRVHPSRDNDKIRQFRPMLHDAVMKNI